MKNTCTHHTKYTGDNLSSIVSSPHVLINKKSFTVKFRSAKIVNDLHIKFPPTTQNAIFRLQVDYVPPKNASTTFTLLTGTTTVCSSTEKGGKYIRNTFVKNGEPIILNISIDKKTAGLKFGVTSVSTDFMVELDRPSVLRSLVESVTLTISNALAEIGKVPVIINQFHADWIIYNVLQYANGLITTHDLKTCANVINLEADKVTTTEDVTESLGEMELQVSRILAQKNARQYYLSETARNERKELLISLKNHLGEEINHINEELRSLDNVGYLEQMDRDYIGKINKYLVVIQRELSGGGT